MKNPLPELSIILPPKIQYSHYNLYIGGLKVSLDLNNFFFPLILNWYVIRKKNNLKQNLIFSYIFNIFTFIPVFRETENDTLKDVLRHFCVGEEGGNRCGRIWSEEGRGNINWWNNCIINSEERTVWLVCLPILLTGPG